MSDVVISIDKDEWWPFYSVREPSTYPDENVTVPPHVRNRWERVLKEFAEVQEEMRLAIEAAS